MRHRFLLTLAAAAIMLPWSLQAETVTTGSDRSSMSLTVYNSNLALIRDARSIEMPGGRQTLAFKEISSKIQPETVLLEAVGIAVLEQNYEFDLLSPASLLQKYVGRQVILVRTNEQTGEETREQATVLSNAGGVVLKVGDSIETGINGRIVYPDVPANLREKPTLTMELDNESAGEKTLELSYLSSGLTWQADYVAELAADESRLDLKGWVTLTNSSGAAYENARLQLIAGDVNRVRPERPVMPMAMAEMADGERARQPKQMSRESLFEYHLYTVGRPVTLLDNQSKQITLLEETGGECSKELLLRSPGPGYYWSKVGEIQDSEGVEVYLTMTNDKASNFGSPKPAGTVRVYKVDSDGFPQFIGEDRIDHTPENEEIRIKLGRSFDVTADRTQTDFTVVRGGGKESRITESEFEVELKNAKDEAVEVIVEEMLPGDWQILSESAPHSKKSATTVRWKIRVQPKESQLLKYRVRTNMG